MRILHLVLEPRLSGAEVLAKDLAIHQQREGSVVGVTALLPERPDFTPFTRELASHGVECVFPARRSRLPGKLIHLAAVLRRFRPDVLFAHATIPAFYARALPTNVPVIYVMHSAVNDFERKLFRNVERLLSSRARAVIGVSPANVRDYKDCVGSHPLVTLIPNGVDVSRFAFDDRPRSGDALPQIVQIGRYTSVKNQLQTVHAFSEVAAQVQDVRLQLYGVVEDPAYLAAIEDLVKKLGLEDRVSVDGPISDVSGVLRGSNAFAMPSRSEGHSIAFLEALASGIPVVASTITPFQFAKTLPGVQLVDTDDTSAYAAALLTALAQPKAPRSLAGLTLQDTAQRYLAVAQQVIGARV
ncbi:glycosyltransferase [Paraburkholderia phymatum]|uniref:Glycosyl transferase group 1 n=1 Tax=Paraburkholderia phymatum (strain DSM 17167 / CIP 108236 / LMG 21445 / STM815) TaxID=391038 RepID=B2JGA3_PARP8|nr:glycosyltransferase [Paraburkholderia phymatum]ACC71631.1 glycosyl transferase group 1 [Paraburkholderia phymatum STM815]